MRRIDTGRQPTRTLVCLSAAKTTRTWLSVRMLSVRAPQLDDLAVPSPIAAVRPRLYRLHGVPGPNAMAATARLNSAMLSFAHGAMYFCAYLMACLLSPFRTSSTNSCTLQEPRAGGRDRPGRSRDLTPKADE